MPLRFAARRICINAPEGSPDVNRCRFVLLRITSYHFISELIFATQMDKEMVVNTNNATPAMQLFIPISKVDANNVYFAEKRKNVILDGNFVKIIYSTDHFEMNGLHLLLQIYSTANSRVPSCFSLDEQLRALKTALPALSTTVSASRTMRSENHSSSHSPGGAITFSDETNAEVRESSNSLLDSACAEGAFGAEGAEVVKSVNTTIHYLTRASPIREYYNSGAKDERRNLPTALSISNRSCEPPVKFIEPPVKFIEHFDPNLGENANQTELLCNIERRIVTNYIEMKAPLKNAVFNLKHQMDGGCFRFARECSASQNNSKMNCIETPGMSFSTYALKISGIWETTTSVGITVKFVKL